jgi:hypothetical protein
MGGYNSYSQGWNTKPQMNNMGHSYNYNAFQQNQGLSNSNPNYAQNFSQSSLNNNLQTNTINLATSWSQPSKSKNHNNDVNIYSSTRMISEKSKKRILLKKREDLVDYLILN